MELHLQSHRFTQRLPDWRAAALAGLAAGVIFLVLDILVTWAVVGSPRVSTHMIAAIVMGRDALASSTTFSPGIAVVALIVHFALAVVFGLILGLTIAPFNFDSSMAMALVVGLVFGLAVYLVDFYGFTRIFSWFADARSWPTLITHLLFGLVAADTYLKLERKEAASERTA